MYRDMMRLPMNALGVYSKSVKLLPTDKKEVINLYISAINKSVDQLAMIDMQTLPILHDQKQKVMKSYLDIERSLFAVMQDLHQSGSVDQTDSIAELTQRQLSSFRQSVDIMLSTQASLQEAEVIQAGKFDVRLGKGFEELMSSKSVQRGDHDSLPNKPEVTVIYSVRDREIDRLNLSVKSLVANSSVGFKVLVVDYGSRENVARELAKTCKDNGWQLVRTETGGWPWSRSRALNLGVMSSDTKLIVTTDIDMIFMTDVLGEAVRAHKPGVVIHCKPWWLDEGGDIEGAWLGDENQIGGFQLMSKSDFIGVRGFNEKILYWGLEDLELEKRIHQQGFETKWLSEENRMYHMWHPTDYGILDGRPKSSWLDSTRELMSSELIPFDQTGFGASVPIESRPILEMLKRDEVPHKIVIKDGYPVNLGAIVDNSQGKGLVELELGSRINPDVRKYIPALLGMGEYLQLYGVDLQVKKNVNFDDFYLSLDILFQSGMVDYYIKDDLSSVFILVNNQKK